MCCRVHFLKFMLLVLGSILTIIVLTPWPSKSQEVVCTVQNRPCGCILATFDDVPAKFNGTNVNASCGGQGTDGLLYQCVEYVRRFYRLVKNIDTSGWRGNANTYFGNAAAFGLVSYPNAQSATPPTRDDILGFDNPTAPPDDHFGHVAIVTSVILKDDCSYDVNIIEQNWPTDSNGTAMLSMRQNEQGHYSIPNRGSYVVQGWLRPPHPILNNASVSPSNTSAGATLTYVYSIANSTSSAVNVKLGASIRKNGTCRWLEDPNDDRTVSAVVGTKDYDRKYVTSSTLAPGLYDVAWTLSSEDGTEMLARREDKAILKISTPPPPMPPTCTLSANPATINQGQSSTLTWTTANNPTSASIDNGVGSVTPAGGSTSVSPVATITYTLTVTNTAGSNNCSATVRVNLPISELTWTQKFPTTSPPGRSDHAMAYDSARGEIVLFGGIGDTIFGDTWVWDGTNWTQKFPIASPPARHAHAMAYDESHHQTVLFGGFNDFTVGYMGDTWVWDGTNWIQKFPVTSPPARSNFAMAYDAARSQAVIFGSSGATDDTWVWDGTNWTQKFPAGRPPGRTGHAMAYDAGRGLVLLFGGVGVIANQIVGLNDTWVWDGTNWIQKFPMTSPAKRFIPAMAYDAARGQTVLFGGAVLDSREIFTDTWLWDGIDWTQQFSVVSPPAVSRHAMAYDQIHRQVVFHAVETWVWGAP